MDSCRSHTYRDDHAFPVIEIDSWLLATNKGTRVAMNGTKVRRDDTVCLQGDMIDIVAVYCTVKTAVLR